MINRGKEIPPLNFFDGFSSVKPNGGRVMSMDEYIEKMNTEKRPKTPKKYKIGDVVRLKYSGYRITITYLDYKIEDKGIMSDYAGIFTDGTFPERIHFFNEDEVVEKIEKPISKQSKTSDSDLRR